MAKGHNIWKPQVYNKLVTLNYLEAAAAAATAAAADVSAAAAVATDTTATMQVTILILDKFFTIIQF